MDFSSRIRLEHQILIKCSIAWPYTEHKPASFQKSIGTTFQPEHRSKAELQPFPLSLLRNDKDASEFFDQVLTELRVHVNDSWCIDVDYDLSNTTERKMMPERTFGSRLGSFSVEDLGDLEATVTEIVDYAWTSWQAFYLENTQTKLQTGGLTGTDLYDLYREYWHRKDGTKSERDQIGTHLFYEYRTLARQRLSAGDTDRAAQYSQVCLNLAKDLAEVEREVIDEFGTFVEKWNQLTAQKENCVKKYATVAREGIAEFWRVEMSRLSGQNRIIAISPDYQNTLRSLDYEEDRAELVSKSRSNPYRRGFELVEAVSGRLGSVSLSMWGILTEWPLEELRILVPACAVAQLQKDSPIAPDFRATRLAEISQANDLLSVPERTIEDLHFLFDQLDESIPGICKCALIQLDIEKEK